jgi:hypothetical protein
VTTRVASFSLAKTHDPTTQKLNCRGGHTALTSASRPYHAGRRQRVIVDIEQAPRPISAALIEELRQSLKAGRSRALPLSKGSNIHRQNRTRDVAGWTR